MKRWLILASIFLLTSLFVFLFNKFYLPVECLLFDESGCINKASNSKNVYLIRRVCNKIEDKCIELLGILHSNEMDSLIPFVSDEHCDRNESVYCAFSSVAYSVTGDQKNAQKFAQKGCELNEGVSCAILAGLELDENMTEKALETSLKGCILNSAAACAIAGTIMIGRGEVREGMQFIDRCCQLGGEDCCQ